MRVRSALALLVVAVPTAARAQVVVGDGVPFTAGELEAALAARSDEPVADVAIEADDDGLRLRTADGTWRITLGDARGATAARMVALHVLEGAPGGATPSPRVAVAPGQTPREARDDLDDVVDDVAATIRIDGEDRTRWLAVRGGLSRGPQAIDLTAAVLGVELGAASGRWLASGELGVVTSSQRAAAGDVRWTLPHARVMVGRRAGRVEVLGGPIVGRAVLDNAPAPTGATMVGAGVVARGRWSVGGAWDVVAGIGADGFRHRIVIRRGGVDEAATPRVAIAATVGLSRAVGR